MKKSKSHGKNPPARSWIEATFQKRDCIKFVQNPKDEFSYRANMGDIRPIGNDTPVDVLLNKTFTGPIRSGYVEVGKDNTCLVKYFKNYAEKIRNFEVRDEDVYLFGFPKSGTTLLSEMIWLLKNNQDYKRSKETPITSRVIQLELPSLFNRKIIAKNTSQSVTEDDIFKRYNNLPNPRCFKSHLHWSLLPQQIQNGTKKPKIIVIVRKVEDVCISFYHHSRQMTGYKGTWEEFCELFLAGRILFTPYWKQVLSFWEHREQSNILYLKFKDVVKNLPESVEKVAKFLNKDLSKEEILTLAEHLSFNSLKKNPSVNLKLESGDKMEFFRSGGVDQYKTVMSSELRKRFEEYNLENLVGSGFDNE